MSAALQRVPQYADTYTPTPRPGARSKGGGASGSGGGKGGKGGDGDTPEQAYASGRPTPGSPLVLATYADLVLHTLKAVRVDFGKLTDAAALTALKAVLMNDEEDGFALTVRLVAEYGWKGSAALVAELEAGKKYKNIGHEIATEEWVVKTGIRFPAKEGDEIKFKGVSGLQLSGKVKGVFSAQAKGLVEDSAFQLHKINAEDVLWVKKGNQPTIVPLFRNTVGFKKDVEGEPQKE